jgi:ABC-type multidrug transport system permease subunit
MNRVLHLALHDTRLFLGARENFFFMFLMPVMFMLFFSVVFTGNSVEDVNISLQVVDEDGGWLSEAFLAQLEGEQFELRVLSRAEADTTDFIRRAVIPAGFTDSLLVGNQVEIGFSKKSDINVEYDAAADVRLHQAQVAFLGALVAWNQTDQVITPERKDELLALIAEPRRVTVSEEYAGRGRPVPSGAGQSIPGMLTMFVIMTVLIGGSESLTREKLGGTLARLAATPMSPGEILGGKILHLGLVGLVQAMVLMAAGQLIGVIGLFGIDFGWGPNFWAVILVAIPLGFSSAALALFFGGIFRTTQQAESLGWLIGMIFSALGGCWWPLEVMPEFALMLARFFPTYWAMKALHGVVTFGRGFDAILLPGLMLVMFGALFTWLGVRTLRVTT